MSQCRADEAHVILQLGFGTALCALLPALLPDAGRRIVLAVGGLVAAMGAVLMLSALNHVRHGGPVLAQQLTRLHGAGSAPACHGIGGGLRGVDADYAAAARYVAMNSAPGEPILAALARHDQTPGAPIGLYVVAERPPVTHWHQFDPGLVDRADVQQAIAAEAERSHLRWVIRDSNFERWKPAAAPPARASTAALDLYLASAYRPVASWGAEQVWLRNGVAAPAQKTDACSSRNG